MILKVLTENITDRAFRRRYPEAYIMIINGIMIRSRSIQIIKPDTYPLMGLKIQQPKIICLLV